MKVQRNKPIDGQPYELEFYDGFESRALAIDKWIPYYLPQWSNRARSAPRYDFAENALVLKIDPDQQPWCEEFNGPVRVSSLQTGLFSGPLGSQIGQHRFSRKCTVREAQETAKTYLPQYGYFELRARCEISAHTVAALWMIGFEDTPEHSAEICLFELKGWNIEKDQARIGYGIHPFGDPAITDDFHEDVFELDATQYNTYAAEWTEKAVSFFINGRKVRTIAQSPAYPMQLMLNIYDLEQRNSEKMHFFVDYVAGYQLADSRSHT